MAEGIDYQQLLGDLELERDNVERMIVWVKGKLGLADGVATHVANTKGLQETLGAPRYQRLMPDTFFRMTVPQAIKAYLNIMKRPRSVKDITAGLDQGGLTHKAKNLYATVYPTLLRMEGAHEVVRVGRGEWGLAEWYPGGRKGNQGEKAESED
jgi:hypothetical protein